MKDIKVLVALGVIGVLVWAFIAKQKETGALRSVVQDVRGLAESCQSAGENIAVTGKALVWDLRSDSKSGAHGLLTSALQACPGDSVITVFMVTGERKERVGRYSVSGEAAYRQYVDIAVAYWPTKKPAGFHSVVSKEPRSSRPVQHQPEYGDPNEPIARWIESLPLAKQP